MTLLELKAALDAAAKALEASPEDEALKTKHAEAKAAYDAKAAESEDEEEGDEGKEGKLDVSKLPPEAQKIIKDLRAENAKARTKNKELGSSQLKLKEALVEAGIIEDDSEDTETKVKRLAEANDMSVVRSAILESAIEHGIGKSGLKYFSYLVQEKCGTLEEGEELSDEDMAALALEAKAATGGKKGAGSTTSVTEEDGEETPGPGASGEVTLDRFCKMNMIEKSDLYTKNPTLYNRLMSDAKKAKKLV